MGAITKNIKDEKVVIAITSHLTCLFGLYVKQMDLGKWIIINVQVVTLIAAGIQDAVFLLEQSNITPITW